MTSTSKTASGSRLERVFTLLENGASPITRKAAAKQLGDVQKKYPHELNNLLAKLLVYLGNNEWTTRIAAAEAIKAVIDEVPEWDPKPDVKKEDAQPLSCDDKLQLSQFDVDRVLSGSQLLLGSSGDEYKPVQDNADLKDHVKKQRRMLEKRLGLTLANDTSLGVSSDDLFKDEDLEMHKQEETKDEIKEPCTSVMSQITAGMSNREKNLAKRKARLLMKQQKRKQDAESGDSRSTKKCKSGKNDSSVDLSELSLENIPKHSADPNELTSWPFEWICDELTNMLFSHTWEMRHGACLALRKIIKKHGIGCGKRQDMTSSELQICHQSWLSDLAVRLLCVITLDRFADYISDQVTAPVRESCAQTLSIVASLHEEKHVFDTVKILLSLFQQKEWEVRQSSMLSLQYIVAVRQDLQRKLLSVCFETILRGLQDSDEDVRSVSAKALLPTTKILVQEENETNLQTLLVILWDSLKSYDELTASAQSVMLLLSQIITTLPPNKICATDHPGNLARRLSPFFHHTSADVRKASLNTLQAMVKSNSSQESILWLTPICVEVLSNLFQSCLLEAKAAIRQLAKEVFLLVLRKCEFAARLNLFQIFPLWSVLSCQPMGVPFESLMLTQNEAPSGQPTETSANDQQKFIGGLPSAMVPSSGGMTYAEHVMETRETVTRMTGALCCHGVADKPPGVTAEQISTLVKHQLGNFMTSQSALQRIIAAMTITGWWEETVVENKNFPVSLSADLHQMLTTAHVENLYFSEITVKFIQVQTDMKALLCALSQRGIQNIENFPQKSSYSFEEVYHFCSTLFPSLITNAEQELSNQRNLLCKLAEDSMKTQAMLDCRVKCYVSQAIVFAATSASCDIWKLPEKLNPVIRPLMESVKTEENRTTRLSVSSSLAQLLGLCASRQPCPNTKLVRNLCVSLTSSTTRCPTLESIKSEFSYEILKSCDLSCDHLACNAIITLLRQQESSSAEINSKKRKRVAMETVDKESQNKIDNTIASNGAECCLQTICKLHKSKLFHVVPYLWTKISSLQVSESNGPSTDDVTGIPQTLVTLKVIVSVVESDEVKNQILSLLPYVFSHVWNPLSHIRYVASRCLAELAKCFPDKVMPQFVDQITPQLDNSGPTVKRRGALEAVASLIESMGIGVVPYAVLLIVPLLGRMSDHDKQIRLLSTHCFAQLIQFMPVETSIPDPPNMPSSLLERKATERRFLEQLFDNRALDSYQIPITINAKLRTYQEDGVKWLAFLNRYKLHGILCDDMGLGKTLQTICIVASDHFYKMQKLKQSSCRHLVSLVVCPPTLTGHWVEEVSKFCDHLVPLHYAGNPQERARLQDKVKSHNLVIASYEVVRNDVTFFSKLEWNYCVLDEGHAIRNGKSKISQCVKTLVSNHRLILTGTPIQNSVLELWSLFDFLVPGFLGSEQEFNARFTKPILASRDAKNSSKEQEEGVIAMEALHRQVLPFMLRRMKEDVLKDLPPKIIQDYYCDLSPLQLQLYEDFAKSQARKDAETSISKVDDEIDQRSVTKDASHVFQALQYLQKVCNHPCFVLSPSHPHYKRFMTQLKSSGSSLHDIKHATKLPSLKQLLLDCGIGVPPSNDGEVSVVGQHRALIFCQHRNMLDIIQNDLFKTLMPTVTFMRLDGGIPANQRFSIVSKFNNDPSIDVLLLTTKVGGLGLNLTGADTVVFVEHDWNPMVDLQAMDRAHRIGQKKVVNVYRLITRGTMEEKILGLQKFKLNIANTVVSEDNRGLQSMGTGQVLDLFNVDKDSKIKPKAVSDGGKSSSKGLRAMIDSLGDLWDQNQYDEEYNLDNFIQSLNDK
uniref:TATA-binding protein-associated factor 172 n=1 Tax=Phallusia mammillata TaxID=59560 RepID=A0A6F9D8K2_9ASCI|nr:TATA-binding protein-associated factor 172 [Phallusia mammillata]